MRLLNFFIFFNIIALFGSRDSSLLSSDLYLYILSATLDDNPATCVWLYNYFNNSQDLKEKVDLGFDPFLVKKLKTSSDSVLKDVFHQNGALVNLHTKTITFPMICNFSITCKSFYNFFKKFKEQIEFLWFFKRSFLLERKDELSFQDIFFDRSIPAFSLHQIDQGLGYNYVNTKQHHSVVSHLIQSIIDIQCIIDMKSFDINDSEHIYFNICIFSFWFSILELKKNSCFRKLILRLQEIVQKTNNLGLMHKVNKITRFVLDQTGNNIINNENSSEIKTYDNFPMFDEFKNFILNSLNTRFVNHHGFLDIYTQNNDEKKHLLMFFFLLKKQRKREHYILLEEFFNRNMTDFLLKKDLYSFQKFLNTFLISVMLFFLKKYRNTTAQFFRMYSSISNDDDEFKFLCDKLVDSRFGFIIYLLSKCSVEEFFYFFCFRDLPLLGWHFHWFSDTDSKETFAQIRAEWRGLQNSEKTQKHYEDIVVEFKKFIQNTKNNIIKNKKDANQDLNEKSELINILNDTSIFQILSFHYTHLSDNNKNFIMQPENDYQEKRKLLMLSDRNGSDLYIDGFNSGNQDGNNNQHRKAMIKKIIYAGILGFLICFCIKNFHSFKKFC